MVWLWLHAVIQLWLMSLIRFFVEILCCYCLFGVLWWRSWDCGSVSMVTVLHVVVPYISDRDVEMIVQRSCDRLPILLYDQIY